MGVDEKDLRSHRELRACKLNKTGLGLETHESVV
jgi:hypothetical protein